MKKEPVSMTDIKDIIYEAGLFRPNEKIVVTMRNCVLLEYFTGKVYSYRLVDIQTLKSKKMFSKAAPLTETDYQKTLEKMLLQISGNKEHGKKENWTSEVLVHIFYDVLPKYGMAFRENQLSLALSMLEAMEKTKVALCEAEVGTGKTHAYILAAVIYRLYHTGEEPVIISTSTIALQKALTEEYIPQISRILLETRFIERPLTYVVRKGKSHYACDSRVKSYLSSIVNNNCLEDKALIETLSALFTGKRSIDLDGLPLTNYVKERICVNRCHRNCEYSSICRYRNFIHKSQRAGIDFQIANHNLILADILSQKGGRKRLLPPYEILIFDEAHKLLDSARQMYVIIFDSVELERLVSSIYRAAASHPDKGRIIYLCEEILRHNELLFELLTESTGMRYDRTCSEVIFSPGIRIHLKALIRRLRSLSVFFYTINHEKTRIYALLNSRMEQIQEKLMALLDYEGLIYWLEHTGVAACRLCALPKQLDFLLYEDIWKRETTCILTSATLSVNHDFSRYMHQTGIDLLEQHRIFTTSKASPFDYWDHALLYLPADMPFPDKKDSIYMDAIIRRLCELIRQTHGHTLALFTSYRMMEIAYQELSVMVKEFPLFCMGKGRLEAIDSFRRSKNGVLLASDSAGEGIDLAGDVLSSLIVVKLPFMAPDPVTEYEKSLYDDFHSYLREVIVPGMLIKLRQWIGRGIRRETDTCVFSILDSRAGVRYRKDILSALPDMPVTEEIGDIGRFLRIHKEDSYFE